LGGPLRSKKRLVAPLMATADDDLSPDRTLFVSRVGSRRPIDYVIAGGLWLLVLVPVALAPWGLLLLPYSLLLGGAALWLSYCIATNRTHQLSVSRERIVWDVTFTQRKPQIVLIRDILRLTVEQRKRTAAPSHT
jgi:hypothetical protein